MLWDINICQADDGRLQISQSQLSGAGFLVRGKKVWEKLKLVKISRNFLFLEWEAWDL